MTPTNIACIIPTHERDRELARALQSVADQSSRPQLVVVVDDVGADSTRRVAETAASGIRVLYVDNSAEQHKGASASRNAGVQAVPPDVDVLAFLDDDDRWEPHFLEHCVSELEQKDLDLVVAWGVVEVAGRVVSSAWSARPGLSAEQVVARNPGVTGSNFVIRRSAFDRVGGFDAQLPVYNDLDFFVRFLEARLAYGVVDEPLVVQSGDGAEHLTSRGPRRSRGIEAYISKHRSKLTGSQLRWLERDRHLAERYRGQKGHLRLYHFVMMWAKSSPEQLTSVVRARVGRRHRMYG